MLIPYHIGPVVVICANCLCPYQMKNLFKNLGSLKFQHFYKNLFRLGWKLNLGSYMQVFTVAKINQSDYSIARPLFSKYWIRHRPELSNMILLRFSGSFVVYVSGRTCFT